MPVSTQTARLAALVLAVLVLSPAPCPLAAAPPAAAPEKPETVVERYCAQSKRLAFAALLPDTDGREKKRLLAMLERQQKDPAVREALRRQADLLDGWAVLKSEVYGDLAMVTFAWKVTRMLLNERGTQQRVKRIVPDPHEALLRLVGGRWLVVDVRAANLETVRLLEEYGKDKKRR